jgi:hypothetical protein
VRNLQFRQDEVQIPRAFSPRQRGGKGLGMMVI